MEGVMGEKWDDFDDIADEMREASFNFNICRWLDCSIFLIDKVELKFLNS